jgi:hypothetical protein
MNGIEKNWRFGRLNPTAHAVSGTRETLRVDDHAASSCSETRALSFAQPCLICKYLVGTTQANTSGHAEARRINIGGTPNHDNRAPP